MNLGGRGPLKDPFRPYFARNLPRLLSHFYADFIYFLSVLSTFHLKDSLQRPPSFTRIANLF
jgi:hypothetical protein